MNPKTPNGSRTRTRPTHRANILARGPGLEPARLKPVLRIQSILVPVDFSPSSEKALAYAAAFAAQFQAKLIIFHVIEPAATADFEKTFPLLLDANRVLAVSKGRLERLLKTKRIPPQFVERVLVRSGRSFQEIATAAQALNVDLIIISTHGYTGLKHTLLGSTTERVVRHAPCPVLVVREGERQFIPHQTRNIRPRRKR